MTDHILVTFGTAVGVGLGWAGKHLSGKRNGTGQAAELREEVRSLREGLSRHESEDERWQGGIDAKVEAIFRQLEDIKASILRLEHPQR